MRASIIALVVLVASPLMVFAAPSSQVGSLVVRDAPLAGDLLENLNTLNPQELLKHIQGLTDEGATDAVEKLSDDKLEELVSSLTDDQLKGLVEKVGDSDKLAGIIEKIKN
jgi:Mg/Co/Ni transporter MgtE